MHTSIQAEVLQILAAFWGGRSEVIGSIWLPCHSRFNCRLSRPDPEHLCNILEICGKGCAERRFRPGRLCDRASDTPRAASLLVGSSCPLLTPRRMENSVFSGLLQAVLGRLKSVGCLASAEQVEHAKAADFDQAGAVFGCR